MKSGAWIRSHRRSLLFLMVVLAAAGAVAALRLPVTLFPDVEFPRAVVTLDAGDRPAEHMAVEVTTPAEDAVRRVAGVRGIRSKTSRGTAELSVTFDWGTDMVAGTLGIHAALADILPRLPAGTVLDVQRMDPTVFPMIAYSLSSATMAPAQLRAIADYRLRPLLSGIEGVARVQVLGGALEEVQVTVNPARLQAFGLALADVITAIGAGNVLNAAGRIEDHYKLYLVLVDGRVAGAANVADIVLRGGSDHVVKLGDVASVEPGVVPQWIRVNADGKDAVLLQIYQQPGGDSVRIARDVRAKLDAFRPLLPANIAIANWYDQSRLVVDAAASVRDALLLGVGLAGLVLMAFLRDWRSQIIQNRFAALREK